MCGNGNIDMAMAFKAQQGLRAASDSQETEEASENESKKWSWQTKGFQNCGKTRIVQKIMLIFDDLFGLKIAHRRKGWWLAMVKIPSCFPPARLFVELQTKYI